MKRSFNNHYKPAILWLASCQRYFGQSPTESIHLMLTHGFVFHCGLCVCTSGFEHLEYLPINLSCLSMNNLLLKPLGREKTSLTCHRPLRYKALPGWWGKMGLKEKANSNLSMKKCGKICPVDKHLLCNAKSFVFPWKTNSITVKKMLIRAELIHESVTNPPTVYHWSIAKWGFHSLILSVWHWNMKQLTPMKGSPNAVLSWALPLWRESRFIWGYCHVKGN